MERKLGRNQDPGRNIAWKAKRKHAKTGMTTIVFLIEPKYPILLKTM
jgi:hypothetical protein